MTMLAFLAPTRPRVFAEPDDATDELADSVASEEAKLRRAFLAAVAAMLLLFDGADTRDGVPSVLVYDLVRELDRVLTERGQPALLAAFVQGATFASDRLPVASVGLTFNLVNQRAVDWAARQSAAMVTLVGDETRRAIRTVITRAARDGLSPAQVAREIRALIGLSERDALAVGNLQTALLEDGRKPEQVERMVARYANRLLRRRAETIARTECLPGETPIDAAMVSAIHRRWYEGPIVQITTAHGRHFSATPNHPMLTNRGWLPMEAISQGDYLVSHDRQQSAGAPGDQNVQATPPTIAEIFDALSAVWISERKRGRKPDFHGDGMEGNVDTLRSDRMLAVGRFSPLYEPVVKRLLAVADLARAPFCHVCSRLLSIDQQPCLCRAPSLDTDLIKATPYQALRDFQRLGDGGNRFTAHEALSDGLAVNVGTVVRGVSTPTDERTPGVASGPRFPGRAEYASDPLRVSGHRLGDHRDTQSASVQLDRVTSILFRSWSGHVYNLSTPYGYFAANEVYTGNTMTAANRGQEALWSQAVADGLLAEADWDRMWLVAKDERTCKVCKPLDRRRAPMLSGTFPGGVDGPPVHPRCLPGTSKVSPTGRITAATKRWYDGQLIVIRTASGKQLSCTPNHPILTPSGWVAAGRLDIGSHVIGSGLSEWLTSGDTNHEHVPAAIQEVAETFRRSFQVASFPMPVAPEDFHGDGEGSKIAVVWTDRLLRNGFNAALPEHLSKDALSLSLVRTGALATGGLIREGAYRLGDAASGGMCSLHLPLAIGRGHVGPLQRLGLALASGGDASGDQARAHGSSGYSESLGDSVFGHAGQVSRNNAGIADINSAPPLSALDAGLLQSVVDDDASDAKLASDLLAGSAGPVFVDDVVSIDRQSWHGFVFNLETESGAYTAEGIITHNCRCTTGLVLK